MSAYWVVEVELHIFFTLTLWILDQAALSSGVGTPVFLIGGSVSLGPVWAFRRRGIYLALVGIEPQVFETVAQSVHPLSYFGFHFDVLSGENLTGC
jgi:hypothetical protein